MHPDGICIVGLGARTPVGRSWPGSAAAVRASVVRFEEHPLYTDPNGRRLVVSRADWLDPARDASPHLSALAVPAAREALLDLPRSNVRTWLALPSLRPGRPDDLEQVLSRRLRDKLGETGHTLDIARVIAGDHSAGVAALALACEDLREGRVELALVGGVDSLLEFDTLDWLISEQRVRTINNPRGFIPGEGAGFVLLATPEAAARRGLPVLGRVLAVSLAHEAMHARDAVNTGVGLTRAALASLAALPPGTKVATRYCDLNGEPHRASEYGFATVRISDRLERADSFVAPAECWGDVGAATAPLLLGLAVAAARRGHAAGTHSLLTTSAGGGLCGAVLVHAQVEPGPEFL
ncbi:MAG TPA: beta-ketoacyl synthase N-terminal-like domain-containing protein [Nannocystis sp.]